MSSSSAGTSALLPLWRACDEAKDGKDESQKDEEPCNQADKALALLFPFPPPSIANVSILVGEHRSGLHGAGHGGRVANEFREELAEDAVGTIEMVRGARKAALLRRRGLDGPNRVLRAHHEGKQARQHCRH